MAKGARKNPNFKHPDNPKRGEAKLERNKGQKAIQKAGVSESEWSSKFDPLLKIGGLKRYKIVNNIPE